MNTNLRAHGRVPNNQETIRKEGPETMRMTLLNERPHAGDLRVR